MYHDRGYLVKPCREYAKNIFSRKRKVSSNNLTRLFFRPSSLSIGLTIHACILKSFYHNHIFQYKTRVAKIKLGG